MADADETVPPRPDDPETTPESGAKRRGKGKKRHTVLKVVGATALVLALLTGLSVVYAYRHLNGNLTTADYTEVFVEPRPTEEVVDEGPHKPIDILVMGSDSREGDNNIDGLTGMGDRSDTTILLHLSADRKRAYGVSIPRDTLVDRPDCRDPDTGDVIPGGTDVMWNEAFQVGGPGCTQSQFEQITGIRVDHTVVVDFQGFEDMVDAVGGVTVCIPQTIDDREHGIYLEAGTRKISGKEALSYNRVRQGRTEDGSLAIDGSDIGRIKRQQAFMASMANKVVSAGTLANPFTLYEFLDAATKSLELSGMDNLMDAAELGFQFRGIGLDKVKFVTIPWQYAPEDPNRVRMLPEAADVWARLKKDEPLTKEQASGSINAQDVPGATSSPDPTETPSGTPSSTPSSTPTTTDDEAAEEAREVGLCA